VPENIEIDNVEENVSAPDQSVDDTDATMSPPQSESSGRGQEIAELEKQITALAASLEGRLAAQSKAGALRQTRSTKALATVIGISLASLLASVFTWYSNSNLRSLAASLDERIESFVLMDPLITTLQEEIELAGLTTANLESQVLGFEGSLGIALEQMRLTQDEYMNGLDVQIEELNRVVAGFGDEFTAFSDSNRAMSLESRRVVQSMAQLEELKRTLDAIVVLEQEKYYDLMTGLMRMDKEQIDTTSDSGT
jgi:hypothetical protein